MTDLGVFFSGNIRLLRERNKLTQEALANELNITRKKLFALESGQTKAPQVSDMINFSRYFKMSIDTLLTVDLTKLSAVKLQAMEINDEVYTNGTNLRVLAISVDKKNMENIEYVPVKVKAGYIAAYNDPEFIASLPKYSFPNLPKGATYRVFPTTGDSMLPIPDGSEVIAKYVTDWKSIKSGTPCIVILKGNQDFVFKLITIQDNGTILLKSLNDLFRPYTVDSNEVAEIWSYYKHQTHMLPEKPTEIQEIKGLLMQLMGDLKKN
ncbi:MAG: XRE family transcriptional regulator [Sphingobacteriales bacterium]